MAPRLRPSTVPHRSCWASPPQGRHIAYTCYSTAADRAEGLVETPSDIARSNCGLRHTGPLREQRWPAAGCRTHSDRRRSPRTERAGRTEIQGRTRRALGLSRRWTEAAGRARSRCVPAFIGAEVEIAR